jgi:hypothetical protein
MASTEIPAVITYHKPGTQPPLFVAGTFSNPPWEPCEMEHTAGEDGEYSFKKEVRGEPGTQIQYKFRAGDDLWLLQEDGPTVVDVDGNTNNVLEVAPQKEQAQSCHVQPVNGPVERRMANRPRPSSPVLHAPAAATHLRTPSDAAAADRSSTGTPIFARIAAEVADSAALLHEEVPERERPNPRQAPSRMPEALANGQVRTPSPTEDRMAG